MTRKHYVYFNLYKIVIYFYMAVFGRSVYVYSDDKRMFIRGDVKRIVGCSITREKFAVDIEINFDQQLKKADWSPSSYTSATYTFAEFRKLNKKFSGYCFPKTKRA